MITVTRDPISLNEVQDVAHTPFLVEGKRNNAIKIYCQSEANKAEYLDIEMHGGINSSGLKHIFDDMAGNPYTGSIN